MKSCEHCGAKHKGTVACGWFKDKPDWYLQQGYDPPCSMDEYDESMRELRQYNAFMTAALIIAVMMIVFWVVTIFGGN